MRNRNFQMDDATHTRLKILAARRGTTLGVTIDWMLDVVDDLEGPTPTDAIYDARREMAALRQRLKK